MAVKKKRKLKKSVTQIVFTVLICSAMIAGIVFFVFNIQKEVKTTFSLKADIKEAEDQLAALEAERDMLMNQKEKLTDENYVSSVARGKYLIFKENEQIYYLPPLDND